MRTQLRRSTALMAVAAMVAACAGGGSTPTPPASTTAPTTASSQAANPTPTAAPVTLTYFTFSAAPDHLTDLNNIVKAFEAKYPNITIDVQTAAYADYFTKLQTDFAAGSAPDTFETDYGDFVGYAGAGSLLDLSTLAASDSTFSASTYYPKAYAAFQYNSKPYALPESFSDVLLFYNKTLFDQAGVAYPTATWTWFDELTAAQKLTNASKGIWGIYQPVSFFEFYKTLDQAGGSFFSADGKQATFNSAAGVTAATWLIDKANKYHVMPTAAQMGGQDDTALFKSGKLAMWVNGIWQFTGLAQSTFQWDVQLEPGDVQKDAHFFANGVAASAKTAHPAEAWLWLKFLSASPDSVTTRVNSSWELPAVSDQSLFSSYLTQTPPANRKAVFDSLANVALQPIIPQESQMQDIVNKALQQAQLGQSSVQDALNSAAQQVNALLQ
jgi:multiple sugar transport system substrate-binding protein